jgi:hypothetical protein
MHTCISSFVFMRFPGLGDTGREGGRDGCNRQSQQVHNNNLDRTQIARTTAAGTVQVTRLLGILLVLW